MVSSYLSPSLTVTALACALLFSACSDDAPAGIDAAVGDAGTDAPLGIDARLDAARPPPDAGPVTSYCANPSDIEAISRRYGSPDGGLPDGSLDDGDGGLLGRDPTTIAGECVVECFFGGMGTDACTRVCFDRDTMHAFSTDCIDCWVTSVNCAQEYCLAECAPPPYGMGRTSEACRRCQCGENNEGISCVERFTRCSGVASARCSGL